MISLFYPNNQNAHGQAGDFEPLKPEIFRNCEESEPPQCVYLCGVYPLPVKALTTFVILACLGIGVGQL